MIVLCGAIIRRESRFLGMIKYKIIDNMEPWSEERFQQELALVSEQRREKVLRYRFAAGRQQSLMAYRLLQSLLLEVYGIEEPPVFRELENGKPVIVGHEDIHFNLSHCKHGVACAVSDEPVGIDIESIPSELKDSLVEYIFSEREQQMLRSSASPTLLFAQLWTMKEAVVKLSGRGLTGKEQLRPLLEPYHFGNSPWKFISLDNPSLGFACCLAVENS